MTTTANRPTSVLRADLATAVSEDLAYILMYAQAVDDELGLNQSAEYAALAATSLYDRAQQLAGHATRLAQLASEGTQP